MNEQNTCKGGISVDTEHIFPIIKKWLYSEKDIFLRELVSNASDAVTKLKRLCALGQRDSEDTYQISVTLDKNARTLTVSDNGIGMTEDELRRYICQIALSGALDFIEKYEGEGNAAQNGIIGHFGLGFYSAFMVSDTVEIFTRSYTDAPAVHWVCNESGEYEIFPAEKTDRGTDVVLHIANGEDEYLSAYKLKEMLNKYCAFMPVEIFFIDADEEHSHHNETDSCEACTDESPKPINDTQPLWQKMPAECSADDYKAFYRKVFNDYRDPLFHIHINADYPLNFKGILYFPRLNHEYDSLEGQVKLYYNQVFVADNIKEVIPEYLLMLKGVLDCPELPLNVSRSYLQNNSYVTKISAHIVKKVADKLNALFNTERETYESIWNDIRTFIEYACMRDKKFYDRVKPALLLRLTDDSCMTVDEYLADCKEKHENTIYYAADPAVQAQYISLFEAQGLKVAIFDRMIDVQFIQTLEQNMNGVKFVRIDADVANALRGEGEAKTNPALEALFREVSGNDDLTVKFENLKETRLPAMLNIAEDSRRMEEMMRLYTAAGAKDAMSFPQEMSLVVNVSAPLIKRLSAMIVESTDDNARRIAKQIYMLAVLAQRQFRADELQNFLEDSFTLLEQL